MELRPETPDSGKPNTATTAFARSRLPRSLLIAHSVDAGAGFVGVWLKFKINKNTLDHWNAPMTCFVITEAQQ